MTDETLQQSAGTPDPEAEQNQPQSGYRDVIAERLAQRRTVTPPQPDQPEQLQLEEVEPKPHAPIREMPAIAGFEPPQEEMKPEIELLTESMEIGEATPVSAPPREPRPQQERRERNRGRRERRPDRPQGEGERRERPDRPERREERPERQERPERRPERPRQEQRPEQKTQQQQRTEVKPQQQTGSPLTRAKALASKLGVSVVIPLYNEQESLRELHGLLREELFRLCEKKYEIIFVNDGSTDRSADILHDLAAGSSRVTVLSFRRNMGKSPALAIGFREAKHGIVVTMDADLQDDPKELVNLIAKLDEGYDLVTGWKKKRNDPMSKTAPSKLFNRVTSFFSGIKLHDFNCGLKAYRKEVTDSLDVYGELHRYLPALAHWKGFKVAEIPVVHHPRRFGKSKFGTSRFFKGFLDLLSIVFTNRYGKRPLHLFGTVGTLIALAGLVINAYVTVEWFQGIPLSNRPILLLGVLLILVGVQLVSLGLLGEMIVKNSGKHIDVGVIRDKRAPRNDRPDRERPDRDRERRRSPKPAA